MAIGKQIISMHCLAGASQLGIRADKTTLLGIIIAINKIVQARFCIVKISMIAERICYTQTIRHGTRSRQDISPCIIGIGYYLCTVAIHKARYITLRILQIKIFRAIKRH